MDVSAMLKQGVIASLSMGRWRAEQRLLPEDLCLQDLGATAMDQYISLGKKSLIPPALQKQLNAIESSARYAIKRFALETPFGMFVPAGAYPELEKEMDRFEKSWMEKRDVLADELRKHEKEVRNAYRELALSLYKHIRAQEMTKKQEQGAARRYAAKIIDAIPSADQVRDSFRFEFQVFYVPLPTVLDKAVRDQLLNEEKMKLKIETEKEKDLTTRRMNAMIAERYEKRKDAMLDQFLIGVNSQVRTMVHTVVESALGSMKKNESLVGKTVGQLQNMTKRFRTLNILNDKEIEEEIKKLEVELEKRPKERDDKSIERMLVDLRGIARHTALELNRVARTPRGNLIGDPSGESHGIVVPHKRQVRRGNLF
jgi:hypothetical protein